MRRRCRVRCCHRCARRPAFCLPRRCMLCVDDACCHATPAPCSGGSGAGNAAASGSQGVAASGAAGREGPLCSAAGAARGGLFPGAAPWRDVGSQLQRCCPAPTSGQRACQLQSQGAPLPARCTAGVPHAQRHRDGLASCSPRLPSRDATAANKARQRRKHSTSTRPLARQCMPQQRRAAPQMMRSLMLRSAGTARPVRLTSWMSSIARRIACRAQQQTAARPLSPPSQRNCGRGDGSSCRSAFCADGRQGTRRVCVPQRQLAAPMRRPLGSCPSGSPGGQKAALPRSPSAARER
jgi:hypothetical protein